MAIVSVAIVLSFHLRKTATEIELRMAKPLGFIFWVLSIACLGVGVANYISMPQPTFYLPFPYLRCCTTTGIPPCHHKPQILCSPVMFVCTTTYHLCHTTKEIIVLSQWH